MNPTSSLPRVGRVQFFLSSDVELPSIVAQAIESHSQLHPASGRSSDQALVGAWARMQFDVPNGGFTQFFYNHRGDGGVPDLASLLESLELPKAAKIVRDAHAVYRRHQTKFDVSNPWD